jgi:hypothetical protein
VSRGPDGEGIVLCRRVPYDSMADEYSENPGPLTCPECVKRWAKLRGAK